MNLAVITARGGSKRIPSKNIKEFLGKPIIAYSIEAALGSHIFDIVMVSTDDRKIASVATKYGAEVPFYRSSKNSDDNATTSDVLLEVIETYRAIGKNLEIVCCLYPTAPFVTSQTLKSAYKLIYSNSEISSVIPIVRYSYPPQRALILDNGFIKMKYLSNRSVRTQDLEQLYHDAGQFYMFRAESFLETKDLWTGRIVPIIRPETHVQDIDTLDDWEIAEMKYRLIDHSL